MPVQDQAVWRSVTVPVSGKSQSFQRGELLPPPASEAENSQRSLLRLGGALRVVEVVFTPEELAARQGRPGQGPAATSAGAGVTAAVAPAPGADPRSPNLGGPVVLGPKPAGHATKKEWAEYAQSQGMDKAEAEGMTRDQLAEHYRDA
jgi:hypothetical protein